MNLFKIPKNLLNEWKKIGEKLAKKLKNMKINIKKIKK
jgi:hypothetical protein